MGEDKLFVIGDIHGCLEQLIQLLEKIRTFHLYQSDKVKLVFLGDYVDRGPKSPEVVDYLLGLRDREFLPKGWDTLNIDLEAILLMGNHEDMLIHSFETNEWNMYSNLTYSQYLSQEDFYSLDKHMRRFYKLLPLYHIDGPFLFIHAGLNPNIKEESEIIKEEALWSRDFNSVTSFDLNSKDYTVIHGHTPYISDSGEVMVRGNNINIDTACVFGGHLTALKLDRKAPKNIHSIRVPGHKE